jgi:hypothetical protein
MDSRLRGNDMIGFLSAFICVHLWFKKVLKQAVSKDNP